MFMINATTAIVYTHAELAAVVGSDNGIDYVYLGADIDMTAGIRVNTAKTTLVIDGLYAPLSPDIRVLSDPGGNDQQIYVNGSQSLTLTFQNLTIYGRNYYGMPHVYDYPNARYVEVVYRNVNYSGPQLIWHVGGLTRIIDCDITIEYHNASPAQELGEVNRVEIGGTTVIRKEVEEHSIFWFYGNTTQRPALSILAGASVTIDTAHYFMYENIAPDIIIEPGASFTLNTRSGFSYTNAHTVRSFIVDENAVFHFTQATNRASYASINIDAELRVGSGASFYMESSFPNSGRLIRFTGSASGLYLNNPDSFVLYNGVAPAAAVFQFTAATPFEIIGNQCNYWEIAAAFPTAGTIDDRPMYKWNTLEWDTFTMRGTASSSQTLITYHDFTQDDLDNIPPLSGLQLHSAKVFSSGNLPLSVDPVVVGVHPVSGHTTESARVRVEYIIGGLSPEGDADENGFFSVLPPTPIPMDDDVTVYSNTPFLLTYITRMSEEDGELILVSSPELIEFEARHMSGFSESILPRQETYGTVWVSDTRADKGTWVLWLKTLGPLQTAENDILDDGLIFIRKDGSGEILTLGAEPVAVHSEPAHIEPDVPIQWEADRGVLVRLSVPVRCGLKYSAQLQWSVYPEGVIPG